MILAELYCSGIKFSWINGKSAKFAKIQSRENVVPRYSTFFCTILNKVVKQKKSSRAVENSEPRLPKAFIFTVFIGEYVLNSVVDRSLLTFYIRQ